MRQTLLTLLLLSPSFYLLAPNAHAQTTLTARDDGFTIDTNYTINMPVLVNELRQMDDPNLPPLSIQSITTPVHGTATILNNVHNEIRYTPHLDYSGADTFTYTSTDGSQTATATVHLSIEPFSDLTIPAFPDAEGFGAITQHGRGGRVIQVTNLNDSGPGSFRAALEASGPRMVVFTTGGTITLNSDVRIRNPHIYIAGQTAPGGGITITRSTGSHILYVNTHDVLIRYITLRNGRRDLPYEVRGQGQTSISTRGQNIIVDHISQSWNWDDLGPWINDVNQNGGYGFPIYNQTWSRNIMAEAIRGHATSFLIGGSKDFFGDDTGTPWQLAQYNYDFDLHHNLFSGNSHRNPRGQSSSTRVINNVVYNWSNRIGNTIADSEWDYIGNYYKPGPMTGSNYLQHEGNPYNDFTRRYEDSPVSWPPSLYLSGNIFAPPGNTLMQSPNTDQWEYLLHHYDGCCWSRGDRVPQDWHRDTPINQSPLPIMIQSATSAYQDVLVDVGNNRQLNADGSFTYRQDAIDQRIINEVLTNTGSATAGGIEHENDVGGFINIDPGTPYTDTDQDGMADQWEQNHFGSTNRGDTNDSSSDFDTDGYTDLEEFLNGSDPTVPYNHSPTPTNTPSLPGDTDGDSDVDIFDYNILIQDFGSTTASPADFDGDSDVDIFDYNVLIQNFGS